MSDEDKGAKIEETKPKGPIDREMDQVYSENRLLKEKLELKHIKPRLLGHWGTTPGLNFIYAHMNRVIKQQDLDMLYIAGPGHGGPGLVANTWLEGTYSEYYPNISEDTDGMQKLFKQFSFPGGDYKNAKESNVTNFKCNNSFLDVANLKWKANFCIRQYKKDYFSELRNQLRKNNKLQEYLD